MEANALNSSAGSSVEASWLRLPLCFELNQGQSHPQVKFTARLGGGAIYLTSTEVLVALAAPASTNGDQRLAPQARIASLAAAREAKTVWLGMRFVGADPNPKVVGLARLPGRVNYFRGNDPSGWRTDVPVFAQVKYEGLYPGIDLVLSGRTGEIEYDFIVAPGSDPKAIRLKFEGVDKLSLSESGDLVLQTAGAQVWHKAPRVYQESGGIREEIRGGFVILAEAEVGFQTAAYNLAKPLVIDPVLSFATFLGGAQGELGRGIAVDAEGYVYVTGETLSSDFPTTAGAFQTAMCGGCTNVSSSDVFVTKFDPTGSSLVYSTYLGGIIEEWSHCLVLDAENNAYVTGYSQSTDFPVTAGAYQTSRGGGSTVSIEDAFVTKLNPTGSALLYSTYLGGDQIDWGEGIVVDSAGNAYVVGMTLSSNFPVTAGSFQPQMCGGCTNLSSSDGFVTKLNPTGSSLIYSSYLGGSMEEWAFGVALDAQGNAYVTGETGSHDFPVTPGAFQTTKGGGTSNIPDGYVAKVDSTGSSLLYSTYLGGDQSDRGHGIAVDSTGHAYVTGTTSSYSFPVAAAYQSSFAGGWSDAFLSKLNPAGSDLVYSTYLGGDQTDEGHGIALYNDAQACVVGLTNSYGFPTLNPIQDTLGNCPGVNSADAFITTWDAQGSLTFSTFLGGCQYDWGHGVALCTGGDAYVIGDAYSSNFPVTAGAYQTTLHYIDAFVAKFSALPWTASQ